MTWVDDSGVHVVDVIEDQTVRITDIEPLSDSYFGSQGASFSPAGRLLASVDGWGFDNVLSLYNLEAGTRTTLASVADPGYMSAPSWSPSGDAIAFWENNSLRTVDPQTGSVSVLHEESHAQAISAPKWSPDSRRVAYTFNTIGAPFETGRTLATVDRSGNRTAVYPGASLRLEHFEWTSASTIAFADDQAVREVTLAGHATNLFNASSRVEGMTFADNASQDWLPLVPLSRSIDLACPAATVPTAGFADVGPTSTHRRAIDCAAWWQVAQGTGTNQYSPSSEVTRAQMATFIARAILESGGTLPPAPDQAFEDVGAGTHAHGINQLAAVGVVRGTGLGEYSPSRSVTRAQMATFIANAYAYRVGDGLPAARGDYFFDTQHNTHEDSINRAAEAGLTGGTGDRQYSPSVAVRRDQMASFLARLLDVLIEEVDAEPPSS